MPEKRLSMCVIRNVQRKTPNNTPIHLVVSPTSIRMAMRSMRLARLERRVSAVDAHDDLDSLARKHRLERGLELLDGELVRDDVVEFEAARKQQFLHLVPRLEHLAPVYAQHLGSLEADVLVYFPGDRPAGDAQERRGAAVAHGAEAVVEGGGGAGHFQENVHAIPSRALAVLAIPIRDRARRAR